MKKVLVVMTVIALIALAVGSALATVAGSKHDLTDANQTVHATTPSISACQFCHTPHLRGYAADGGPLWNKDLPTTNYALYGNGSTLANSTVSAPGNASMACLTCHDGSLSVGAVRIGATQAITDAAGHVASGLLINDGNNQTPNYNIGSDLANDHPVGVIYTEGLAGLAAVNGTGTNPLIVNGVSTKRWQIYGGGNATGTVECGSCHDPHNTAAGETPFLKGTSNTICTDCHANQ